jgi:hypothetical protein
MMRLRVLLHEESAEGHSLAACTTSLWERECPTVVCGRYSGLALRDETRGQHREKAQSILIELFGRHRECQGHERCEKMSRTRPIKEALPAEISAQHEPDARSITGFAGHIGVSRDTISEWGAFTLNSPYP